MSSKIVLEKAAYEVAKQSSVPPLIFRLPVEKGREVLETAQNTPVYMYPATIQVDTIDTYTYYFKTKEYLCKYEYINSSWR